MKPTIVVIQDRPLSMFSRGSDLFKLKVLRYIYSKDTYECFYLSDLQTKLKVKKGKLYKVMRDLEKEGKIIKIKSYPVFWKRKI